MRITCARAAVAMRTGVDSGTVRLAPSRRAKAGDVIREAHGLYSVDGLHATRP